MAATHKEHGTTGKLCNIQYKMVDSNWEPWLGQHTPRLKSLDFTIHLALRSNVHDIVEGFDLKDKKQQMQKHNN